MELASTLRFTLRLLFRGLPAERILLKTFARMLEYPVVAVPEALLRTLLDASRSQSVDVSSCLFVPGSVWGKEPRWMVARGRRGSGIVQALGIVGLHTCLASETAAFNVTTRLAGVVPRLRFSEPATTWMPKVATAATVALVSSEAIKREALDSALARFFAVPRWVALGDLLLIDVCSLVPSLRYSQRDAGPVYVRVTALDPAQPSFILKDTTAISQGPDCWGWLPPSVVTTERGAAVARCPAGMEPCLTELRGSVRAALSGGGSPVKAAFLLRGPRGSGKTQLVDALAKSLGAPTLHADCTRLRGASPRAAEQRLASLLSGARAPCLLCLRRVDAIARGDAGDGTDPRRVAAFRAAIEAAPSGIVVIGMATVDDDDDTALPAALSRCFLRTTRVPAQDATARAACLHWLSQREGSACADVDFDAVARAAAGFVLGDLQALAGHAQRLAFVRARSEGKPAQTTQTDYDDAIALLSARMSSASGAPQVAKVSWDDVGGLAAAKAEVRRLLDPPPALAIAGLRRAGILLFGPPGGGKTLLAKAAANAGQRCFLSVKGPELLSAYVGQSERAVRDVFARARAAQPCLVFLDELDALAPLRGRSGDSAGVMDRVVSQLLSEMDGLQSQADVIVMAATNRPDLIDPALLRPGRLDKLVYVGACESRVDRLAVLTALTRRMKLAPGVLLADVVDLLDSPLEGGVVSQGGVASQGGVPDVPSAAPAVTGADLMALATAAWNRAARRAVLRIQAGGDCAQESGGVEVCADDFAQAARSLGPSVSAEDLAYFQQLHRKLAVAR